MAYEISRDVSSFKTVFCSGGKRGCGLLAAARQARPGGGSTERFFFFLVVTLLYSHSLSVPLELGPHSNKLHLEHHGPNREDEEERETHSSWEKKK